ncbi:RtcB family protein [Sphingomonas sp. PAMC 26617]|uniref:RtcB family protein n=1 Tax=Sphingomonas sp. PAMC 26617 TaxID=1112216 RepID=UPI0002898AF9|nr:RtcB family protein [Sphingomonas sp. PAMC 26617]
MTEANFEFQPVEGGVPIKMWTRGVAVDDKARAQLMRAAQMPFVFKHVAVMPDVHVGIGATIGSVIPTKGAVIPAAVGVDIGCGMMAARTSLTASDLPDNLEGVRAAIERAVPVGRSVGRGNPTLARGVIRRRRSSTYGRRWRRASDRSSRNIPSSPSRTTWFTSARSAPATTSSKCASIPSSGCG